VLLDLVMPAMDGWLVTQHLRQNPQFADLPVIIVSASILSTDESQAYEVGANSFIAKPLDFEQLLRIIEQHLNLQWITTNGDQRSLLSPQFLSAKNIAEQSLVIPPLEILTRLKEIILQGDIRGSIRYASSLKHQSELIPFVEQVTQLAESCQIKKLKDFIRQYV
jgi:two-component system, chemotaxis family, CheB/CheR fusion protein